MDILSVVVGVGRHESVDISFRDLVVVGLLFGHVYWYVICSSVLTQYHANAFNCCHFPEKPTVSHPCRNHTAA